MKEGCSASRNQPSFKAGFSTMSAVVLQPMMHGCRVGLSGCTVPALRHNPRMCYQHPNGVKSLLKHLGLFRFGRSFWHSPCEATSWKKYYDAQPCQARPRPCDLLVWTPPKLPCFVAWVLWEGMIPVPVRSKVS